MPRKTITMEAFAALDPKEQVSFAKKCPANFVSLLGQIIDYENSQPPPQEEDPNVS